MNKITTKQPEIVPVNVRLPIIPVSVINADMEDET